jgi:CheY-like chemotaxis protein
MGETCAMGRRDELPADALVGVHVLVVDDDRDSRNLLRMVLEYCGALVTAVASAEQAMRTLRRIVPDALVADIVMPRRDGYWLIERVRALPADRGGAIPALAITAHGEEHGPARTLAAGFQVHARKPIDPWDLCRALTGLLRRG